MQNLKQSTTNEQHTKQKQTYKEQIVAKWKGSGKKGGKSEIKK